MINSWKDFLCWGNLEEIEIIFGKENGSVMFGIAIEDLGEILVRIFKVYIGYWVLFFLFVINYD